jgi:hypothetical protein
MAQRLAGQTAEESRADAGLERYLDGNSIRIKADCGELDARRVADAFEEWVLALCRNRLSCRAGQDDRREQILRGFQIARGIFECNRGRIRVLFYQNEFPSQDQPAHLAVVLASVSRDASAIAGMVF